MKDDIQYLYYRNPAFYGGGPDLGSVLHTFGRVPQRPPQQVEPHRNRLLLRRPPLLAGHVEQEPPDQHAPRA